MINFLIKLGLVGIGIYVLITLVIIFFILVGIIIGILTLVNEEPDKELVQSTTWKEELKKISLKRILIATGGVILIIQVFVLLLDFFS